MAEPEFFSKEWAEAAGDALTAGPSEETRASKLQEYWGFFDFIKGGYPASWALGCRDLPSGAGAPSYLFVQWGGGAVTDCHVVQEHSIGPDGPSPSLEATYVLGMDYADWKALHEGYDAQRTVMYRKILLEDGDLLEFFKAIYFFVECLGVIGAVPARYS
jgi:hypothetical protein